MAFPNAFVNSEYRTFRFLESCLVLYSLLSCVMYLFIDVVVKWVSEIIYI